MKWLPATAVFAAMIPALTAFGDPASVEISTGQTGTGNPTSDAALTNFTQTSTESDGTTYTIVGDITFSTFTNIPLPTTQDSGSSSDGSTGGSTSGPTSVILSTHSESDSNFRKDSFLISHHPLTHSAPDTLTPAFASSSSSGSAPGSSTPVPDPKGGAAFYSNQPNGTLTFTTDSGNPGSLTLKDLKMTGEGAAIYSKGPLVFTNLKNLTFSGNQAQQSGGAAYTEGTFTAQAIVNAVTLTNNTSAGQGGALYVKGTALFNALDSLKFEKNTSEQAGGGIYTESTLTISNITKSIEFIANTATVPAPPPEPTPPPVPSTRISALTDIITTNISRSTNVRAASSPVVVPKNSTPTLTQETAGNGGAIYAKQAVLISTYKDLSFKSNSASVDPTITVPSDVVGQSGGAIFSDNSVQIEKCTGTTIFSGNKANQSGGGIYAKGSVTLEDLATLEMTTNICQGKGGAIYTDQNLTINKGTLLTRFAGNTSTECGGAIFTAGDIILSNLVEVRFNKNKTGNYSNPINKTSVSSAPIVSRPIITGSTGGSPKASPPIDQAKGGALYSTKGCTVSGITSMLLFENNECQNMGGGAYITTAFQCSNSHRLQFTINKASDEGGGLYCGDDVTLTNLTGKTLFQGNTSGKSGGGLSLAAGKSLIMENLESFYLDGNTATENGGGANIPNKVSLNFTYNPPAGESPPIQNPVYGEAIITGNTATKSGGGIYTKNASFSNLSTVTFDKNISSENGGGLLTQTDTDKIDCSFIYITNVNVTNNSATGTGGGISGQKAHFDRIDNLIMGGNQAKKGGAIYLNDSLTIEKVVTGSISTNTATESGGGIYAKDVTLQALPGSFTIADNKVETNVTTASSTPLCGGGVYSSGSTTLNNISGVLAITGNSVSNTGTTQDVDIQGGGIYAATAFTLNQCSMPVTFDNNSATTKKITTTKQIAGGAIYSPTVTIKNNSQPITFSNNTAKSEATTAATTGNKDSCGGAIGATSVTLSNNPSLTFLGNYAETGGGIGCINGSGGSPVNKISLTGNNFVLFQNNSALNYGGALYGTTIEISDTNASFVNNMSLNRGGAIYGATIKLPNTTASFVDNTSQNDGSAICCSVSLNLSAQSQIVFENNKVLAPATTRGTSINNLGAAIYGNNDAADVTISLAALNGNILFKNNQCVTVDQYCSIGGNVKFTKIEAAAGKTIAFYDAVNVATKEANAQALTLNSEATSTGTILFSGELHEHKSYIPQKITFAHGNLILDKNAELSVVSFTQSPGTTVTMGPGSVLSNHTKEGGGISLNNVKIDFSELVPQKDMLPASVSPPTLRLVSRTPVNNSDKIDITGTITLSDPNGNLYQNSYLGENREVTLFNIDNKGGGAVTANNVTLQGDLGAKKGYLGTWNLDPTSSASKIILKWTFDKYLRWEYIPRDNHFYINSIWGAQNSLVTVKQGILGNMLNNARFEDTAFNNFWASAIGSFLRKKASQDSDPFTYHGRGYTAAIDAKPRQEFILGAAFSQVFGHSYSPYYLDNYKHKGSGHSTQASLYAGNIFYLPGLRSKPIALQSVATYGYMQHDTTTYYPSIEEKNTANWDSIAWLFDLRLSLDLREPKPQSVARFTCYAEAEYTRIRQEKFTELDYDPRFFSACSYDNLVIPIGVSVDGAISSHTIIIYNKLSAAYLPVIYRKNPKATYETLSTKEKGQVMNVLPTRNAGRAEVSSQIYLGSYWTLYGTYTIDASTNTLVQMANGGMRFIF
ncbi:Polymorphic membrane protein F,chlamydial polymorphic outer membrane protein repeat,Autotransporter beta-domain [Chlamydia serpentis]|uniref:Polymorphic membrane protein F,chlamydial polymorphic outer membrane protein repeat,Autotransporter beta-domain n=1 Tax=Chlamydia serpentis TaxID=1967782 RepID=A0A2R8FB59_9CHLA|nr:autotransporter domain-containing protein [Chlamydia serpentis]SPN73659.1 Polymorphic membrane protein F,chlamydial polymorphic outer membrane protein repeat,Autotransporter beta-domain [Chlamydia serpentis]